VVHTFKTFQVKEVFTINKKRAKEITEVLITAHSAFSLGLQPSEREAIKTWNYEIVLVPLLQEVNT